MQITWYGHSAFRLDFSGNAVLIDPFFTGNPSFKSDKAAAIKGVSQIVLTHGHGDHVGDTLDIAKQNGATVTGDYDLLMWLGSKGLEKLNPMMSPSSVSNRASDRRSHCSVSTSSIRPNDVSSRAP